MALRVHGQLQAPVLLSRTDRTASWYCHSGRPVRFCDRANTRQEGQAMKPILVMAILLFTTATFATEQSSDFGTYKAREIRKSNTWINGAPVSLKSLRGKVVVLDFWAFDCDPCIEAMPHIKALYDKYA